MFRLSQLGVGNETNGLPSEMDKLGTLTHLIWRSASLTGTIPTEWGNHSALLEINMQNNELIGPFPSEIGGLTSLTLSEMYNNNIGGSLPTEIGNMKVCKAAISSCSCCVTLALMIKCEHCSLNEHLSR